MSIFEQQHKIYKDESKSDFERGVAKGKMDEMARAAMAYNKENKPEKYHADQAKKAKERAEYHEQQLKGDSKKNRK